MKEPLCTLKELVVFAVICVVYCSIFFSLDPQWVCWAAPLAFGGSLYAGDPPASAHFSSPHDVLVIAYLFDALCLLAVVLVALIRGRCHLDWLTWLKSETESKSISKALSFLKSVF